MPNWCHNSLEIQYPDKESLDSILTCLMNEEFELDFSIIKPMPKEETLNWYEWNIKNWGTKWNANGIHFELREDELFMTFETAWAPPMPWFHALCYRLNDISKDITATMRYEEFGMMFCGHIEYSDEHGVLYYDGEVIDIDITSEEEVKYDDNLNRWRSITGKFVSEDNIGHSAVYYESN